MNRKNLTAALLAGLAGAAGIAGTAQAVNLNPDGLGQVLVYPYYTVNGGNLTLLSVVNTTDYAKAVKVRFLESQNSREVLDFNMYMSPWDVWVAAIADNGGTPTLFIDDTTCTVPYLYGDFGGSQAFLTFNLDDGGPMDISRTAEGHFEMIEMGVVTGDSAAAATHVAGVIPNSEGTVITGGSRPCGRLVDQWTEGPDGINGSADDGAWLQDELTEIDDPMGGLFGGAAIVNVDNGTMYSYDARAINGFATTADPGGVPLHQFPGRVEPSLNSGDVMTGYVFTDNGASVSASYNNGVEAVSYVFMHDAIMNEYNVDADLNASSEWVATFPTKSFFVNGALEDGQGLPVIAPVAPFTSVWDENDDGDWVACEPVLLDKVWDREEQDIFVTNPGDTCPPIVSPLPPDVDPCGIPFVPFQLCWEANVIRFGDDATAAATSDIFGAPVFTNVDTKPTKDDGTVLADFSDGWARIDMLKYVEGNLGALVTKYRDELGYMTGYSGATQWGLPVTGFWALEIENNFLGDGADVIANYGGLFDHKATRCFAGVECRDD